MLRLQTIGNWEALTMSGFSILIVDDDPGATEAFEPMLRAHGYRARVAGDVDAAINEIERQLPDAILLDLHLPKVDGLEFLRTLRAQPRYASIPAALVTGDYLIDSGVASALQELEARLHFKPLWEEDVVQIIEDLLATDVRTVA
jgi:CheY-like chemotaxis protein